MKVENSVVEGSIVEENSAKVESSVVEGSIVEYSMKVENSGSIVEENSMKVEVSVVEGSIVDDNSLEENSMIEESTSMMVQKQMAVQWEKKSLLETRSQWERK